VEEGDILVTNIADPGWTPVFLVISDVIVETGGMLSHASCLAREYGFPAIQLEDATRLLRDGDIVRPNGNTGVVYVDGYVMAEP
jgi:pyruvate,water dikinase